MNLLFFLVPNIHITVRLDRKRTEKFPVSSCKECKVLWDDSHIYSSACQINWGFVNTTTYLMEREVSPIEII